MEYTRKSKITKCDWALIIGTLTFILLVTIIGICVYFVDDSDSARLALIILITLLSVIGFTLVTIIFIRRNKAMKKIQTTARKTPIVKTAPNRGYYATAPTLDLDTKNYSNRTTMQA